MTEQIVEKKKRRTKEQVLADKAAKVATVKKVKVPKPPVVTQIVPVAAWTIAPIATKEVPLFVVEPVVQKSWWQKLKDLVSKQN